MGDGGEAAGMGGRGTDSGALGGGHHEAPEDRHKQRGGAEGASLGFAPGWSESGARGAGRGLTYPPASLLPADNLAEVQLALCGHDGLLVLPVVADEVADALKEHVLGPDLGPGAEQP